MKNEIKQAWHFSQSPQEVWEYLTKPELLEQWLVKKIDFQPIPGHKFSFVSKKGEVNCEVLEVNPYTKLSYSWQFNSDHGDKADSKVLWTLLPKEDGTELQLVHSGFTVLEDFNLHNNGWATLGTRLLDLLNTVKS